MIILDCDQNSPEWEAARLGIPTASCFKKIMTSKAIPSKSRTEYLYKLAGEKITGEKANGFYSKAFERGHEREQESADLYQFMTGADVQTVGFCFFDELKRFGASPDRLVGEDGGFETKDAEPHVQLKRLNEGWTGAEHYLQCVGCMYVTGRSWWDLQSYSRGLKPITIRFERDDVFIAKMAEQIAEFLFDLNAIVAKYAA